MSFDKTFLHNRSDRSLAIVVACLIVCIAMLLAPQTAEAVLPTQNELDPRHLDFGPVTVGPGETVSQVFADELNSAEDWFAELLIGNPSSNASAVAFDAKLVWPGGSQQGTISLQPGFGYLLQVEPVDVPETRPNWLFNFKNPTSLALTVESVVSEALSMTIPPEFGEIFVDPNGNLVAPGGGNQFRPGDVVGDFVSLGIVPEPTGLLLAVIGVSTALVWRRRTTTA